MGVSRERIKGSLRFSLGHTTTEHDINVAIEATVAAAAKLGAKVTAS
jgi:cysteine sulfinate desulfinase/cysteine desulfurase-like protein